MKQSQFLVCVFVLFTQLVKAQFTFVPADHHHFIYTGRIDYSKPKTPRFSHPGVSIKAKFTGNICKIRLKTKSSSHHSNFYTLVIDDELKTIEVSEKDSVFNLPLSPKASHLLTIFKRTESLVGEGIFEGLEVEKGAKLLPLERLNRKIEFIGNSITCGYGNEGENAQCSFTPATENNYMAYGAITARKLGAEYVAVAYSGKGVSQNYDRVGETLPQVYARIFPDTPKPYWNFNFWTPDAVVINLGTNDFAHGIPDSATFVADYLHFISSIRKNYPKAYLFCIEGTMTNNNWPKGVNTLDKVKSFINTAVNIQHKKGDKKITSFFPSSLKEGEYGCDYHPNIKAHHNMAEELTLVIREKLKW